MNKILFVNDNLIFYSLPQNTTYFYVFNKNNKSEFVWFLNHFNEICAYKYNYKYDDIYLDFFHYYDSAFNYFEILQNKSYYSQKVDRQAFKLLWGTYVNGIIEMIKKNRYVYASVKIIDSKYYKLDTIFHDITIFGFNDEEKIFYCIDFF